MCAVYDEKDLHDWSCFLCIFSTIIPNLSNCVSKSGKEKSVPKIFKMAPKYMYRPLHLAPDFLKVWSTQHVPLNHLLDSVGISALLFKPCCPGVFSVTYSSLAYHKPTLITFNLKSQWWSNLALPVTIFLALMFGWSQWSLLLAQFWESLLIFLSNVNPESKRHDHYCNEEYILGGKAESGVQRLTLRRDTAIALWGTKWQTRCMQFHSLILLGVRINDIRKKINPLLFRCLNMGIKSLTLSIQVWKHWAESELDPAPSSNQ